MVAMDQSEIMKIISLINAQLHGKLSPSSMRNYQHGSVYVTRSKQIIGLCFDGISGRDLHHLTIDPQDFPNLIDLVIRTSSLRQLPSWIFEFHQIENLILKSLDLRQIGDIVSAFPNLSFLALPNNQLRQLPDIHLLPFLSRLNLNHNHYERLPDEIVESSKLVSLTMDHNYITDLPEEMRSVILQAVSLENNQLSTFPAFLEHMPHLYSLNLSRNFLNSIPSWIGSYTNLQYLNLSSNRLRSVPTQISDLRKLRLLELQGNPSMDFPLSVLYGLDNLEVLDLRNSVDLPSKIDKIRAYQKLFDQSVVVKS